MARMTQHSVDPAVTEAVQQIENRFGVQGLEDLIALAEQHLGTARAAMAELAQLEAEPRAE